MCIRDRQIERRLSYYVNDKGIKVFTLKVSPILGAYLSRGLINSYLGKWKRKYKCKISLVEDNDFSVRRMNSTMKRETSSTVEPVSFFQLEISPPSAYSRNTCATFL